MYYTVVDLQRDDKVREKPRPHPQQLSDIQMSVSKSLSQIKRHDEAGT